MVLKNKFKLSILTALVISISGCSFNKPKQEIFEEKKYVIEEPREKVIHEAIMKAAKNAEKSLQILAAVNNAEKAEKLSYEQIRQARWRSTYTPVGLERTMTINDWDGPIKPVWVQIEKRSGYEIKFLTKEPATGLFISLDFQEQKLIDIIRSINAQLNDQIRIDILEDDKIIEVSYVQ